jgi:Na+-transporting NADH:ubiquinone oxidoreductase subunit NqrC
MTDIGPATLAIIVAVSSLAGVIVTSIFNYLNNREARRSEERRHQKQLIIQAAIENWKQQIEVYKGIPQVSIPPLDAYIIHMVKFTELILEGDLTIVNFKAKMDEVTNLSKAASTYADILTELNETRPKIDAQSRVPTDNIIRQ